MMEICGQDVCWKTDVVTTENVTLGIDGNGLSMNGICDRSSLVRTIVIQSSSFMTIHN